MATLVQLRELTADERRELGRLARSRTEEARLVVRAKIVLGLAAGERPYQVADRVGVGRMAAYEWLHRFNAEGLKGLTDHPRPGRPHTYTPGQRAEVIAAALTKPDALGLPFASWTLDRLQAYLSEHKGIGIKRTRIDEILIAEGLRWRKQETWFGQKVDPEFAEKRGRSKSSTRPRPTARPSSAWTRWGRKPPRASRAKR
jgi:transposase